MTLATRADGRASAVEAKYSMVTDPGIRRFMVETELFYPADVVNFTITERRAILIACERDPLREIET